MLFLFFVFFVLSHHEIVFFSFSFCILMRHQISAAEYQPIRNRNWWFKIVSGTVCVGQKSSRGHDYANETLPETKDCLSNITGKIPKLQKFTGEHQEFKISLGVTQITNILRGGKKSEPFSPGTDFVGLIFTGELSGVDSPGVLRQGVSMD